MAEARTDDYFYYYVSKDSSAGFKQIKTHVDDMVTNGKKAYYVSGSYLYSFNLNKMSAKKVKKIPSLNGTSTQSWVTNGYKNLLLIECLNSELQGTTMIYNTKTKKLTNLNKLVSYSSGNGKYFVAAEDLNTDVGRWPIYLYKYTSKGVKRVKKLANYAASEGSADVYMTNKYIYYIAYSEDLNTIYLYRRNKDGSGKKLLFTKKGFYTNAYVDEITSKYFTYYINTNTGTYWLRRYYKYTYSTKKTTFIGSYVV